MCGILAVFYKKERQLTAIAPMLDEMKHRGKDQYTIKNYPKCDIGFVRLAITDINTPQPGKANGWETWINGEIYNYKDLGFSGSECEVLAQGFAKYGPDFVKRLNGMFAIIAVHQNEVFVFRDRWGQKPLYRWEDENTIIISSEIKPILKFPAYKFSVNDNAKSQLLTFSNIFTGETLFSGINKVDKGTWCKLSTNEATKYFQWDFSPEPMPYEEAKREARRLVEQSVKRQTPNEVSYGSCLSGGVDSGIIAGLLGDIPTFTVGYKGQEDERQLAELMGRQQYEVIFDSVSDFHKCIYHLETPLLGASWMHVRLYELASKFVTVLFDGAGADELFFGYEWRYKKADYWDIVNRTGIEDDYCRKVFEQVFPVDTLAERFKFDANHFLESVLLVVDRLSMSQTIEVRTPFMDNDLAEFACKIPFEYKQGKKVLKDAFRNILPVEVRIGKKKGFSTPAGWIEGQGTPAYNWITKALATWEEIYNFGK